MSASARGLFRATGKETKPIGESIGSDLAGDFARPEFLGREANEFYPTPPEPTLALIAAERGRLKDFSHIWEPAAGDGAMMGHIVSCGFDVVGSDLIDRGADGISLCNFYDARDDDRFGRAVITNPPFAECNKDPGWVRHGLETVALEYMALLLPLNWMGSGSERAALWAKWPPSRIYVMRWRIDWTGQGAPPMINCWYVWDRQHVGETVLRTLDRKDARQSELFGEAP